MHDPKVSNRSFGMALVVTAVLSVFFMLHHPVAPGEDASRAAAVGDMAGAAAWIHGLLCLALVALWAGVFDLTRRLGWDWLSTLGFLLFSAAVLGYGIAAMISGFISPTLALDDPAHFTRSSPLLWAINQAFANAGAVATSLALVCWSIALVRITGLARWAGVAGLLGGLTITGLLIATPFALDVRGMTVVTIVHCGWYAMVGAWMLRVRR